MKIIVVMVIMVIMVSQEEGEIVVRPTVHLVMVMVMKVKSLGWINTPFEQQEQHTGTRKSSMMLRMWIGAQQARKSSSITSRAMLGHEKYFQYFSISHSSIFSKLQLFSISQAQLSCLVCLWRARSASLRATTCDLTVSVA